MIDEDGWLKVVIDTRRSEVMKQSKRSDAASEWTDRAIGERETIHFLKCHLCISLSSIPLQEPPTWQLSAVNQSEK